MQSGQHHGSDVGGTDAPAELDGDTSGFDDSPNHISVDRFAPLGTIEIDDVQAVGTLANPLARHCGGVVRENCLLRIVTLAKTHTAAAEEIDGGVDKHLGTHCGRLKTISGVSASTTVIERSIWNWNRQK